MSDDLQRLCLRWSGHDRKGLLKIGDLAYALSRLPASFAKRFFDIWYSPGLQMEVRDRACDPKRELTAAEDEELRQWMRPLGALAREFEDKLR